MGAWASPAVTQRADAARPAVRSRMTVTVPRADATLQVQGAEVAGAGTRREFETGPLEPGRTYDYEFAVEWKPNNYTILSRSGRATFRAGDAVTVDLAADGSNDRARIRYVATSEFTMGRMIDLAKIGPGDVVFEPGCGDARITIAAVKAGARRGVGIDLDPALVDQARLNVKSAGLDGKVEIRLGDALDIKDLSDASVVFLYMGEEFNLLIRPILWRQLKVGARVVSHRFKMGDWAPDHSITDNDDTVEGSPFDVHVWTITDDVKRRVSTEMR